jgi:uncharacterized repeat protein (TIGR01451 family)
MKSKHIIFSASLVALLATAFAQPVIADGCTNQYGATVTCPTNNLSVNKRVRTPNNMYVFVENLTSNDPAYSPSDLVEYDIAVSNSSSVNYSEVTVTDTLPAGLTFEAGPGSFDRASNTLTYTITDLAAGATVHSRFTARVKDAAAFGNADITCDVKNDVKVKGPQGQTDEDTASLCVQTKVLGATTLPVAGFDDHTQTLAFAAVGLMGLSFLILNKRRIVS